MKISVKIKGGLMLAFILLSFVTVRAASSYTVSVDNINADAFPAIEAKLKISGDTTGLVARNLEIQEKGVENHGALVLLPPAPPATKIDLFIMVDESGLKENEPVVVKKLEALSDYLGSGVVDAKVLLSTFSAGASGKTDALAKISQLTGTTARSGAQKVLLIVNGTPFLDLDRGDAGAGEGVSDTIGALITQDFVTFVVGYPFRNLRAFGNSKFEDTSLSHSVPGGYLGSFSTDLTRPVELLKNRDTSHFTLYYTSQLMLTPENVASGASVDLFVSGFLAGHFSLPAISPAAPTFSYLTAPSVMLGSAVPVRIEVEPNGKMIAEAELTYMSKSEGKKIQLLKYDRMASTAEALIYEGEIPAGDYPEEDMSFFVTVYTPFDLIGGDQDRAEVAVDLVDDGIILTPRSEKNGEGKVTGVTWTLSGTTVEMGSKYEIYYGGDELPDDKPLKELSASEKVFTIPITGDCDQYQIIKARVWVRAGQPKPAGWSLFSRPGEFYAGAEQASVTEEAGVQKMIDCLSSPVPKSIPEFRAMVPTYRASSNLNLNKLFYYLTAISDPQLKQAVRVESRYGLLYLFMNVVSQAEYDTYSPDSVNIPLKLVYKAITAANQIGDNLMAVFNDSLVKLERRLRGNTSI